jgi:glycyl-tRNA synthetase beta chain
LTLVIQGIAGRQEDTQQEITGPPRKAAFDAQGKPTKAALGFAKKHGLSLEELAYRETPKGEYLFVQRTIPGRPTLEVLAEVLPGWIEDIPWPKSMRWGHGNFNFVRPIHWLLALYEGHVVSTEVGGVKSGDMTAGHRFMAPDMKKITGYHQYLEELEESFVILDQRTRENRVKECVFKAASTVSAIPDDDPDLVKTVANLVEYPSAVCGTFENSYLSLPEPVLITSMREHQKYFALRDDAGRLMPHFVAVNNTKAKNDAVVRSGHEKVLRARLADAVFFFKEDRNKPLIERLEALKGVIYQADLGTSFEKVERFTKLAESISSRIYSEKGALVQLAAQLCKCDLVTEMVMEFPSLQGTMGREYALLDGHPLEVCLAIQEHYLPVRAGGTLPSSVLGAIIGVADRLDTISGCFAIGLEPTGAADPFALRRHALAVIRILEEKAWDISLKSLIEEALSHLKSSMELAFQKDVIFDKVIAFFRERYKQMMLRSDYGADLVEAIISSEFDVLHHLAGRMADLKRFIDTSGEFESLVFTVKRVANIIKNEDSMREVNPSLFKKACEVKLWDSFQEAQSQVSKFLEEGRYLDSLHSVMGLREPVDELFDGVEILTKKAPEVRENRIALLQGLSALFMRLADFSKFSI